MVRLGQNFLADPNLLDAIVRDAELEPRDVVLEVGAGEGVLTGRLAAAPPRPRDRDRPRARGALAAVASLPGVDLHWGDAMKFDFAGSTGADGDGRQPALRGRHPRPAADDRGARRLRRWTVMVQREIADRLRPRRQPHLRSPSVLAQIACEVELVRTVDPAVFRPRPRVESAILGLRRPGRRRLGDPGAGPGRLRPPPQDASPLARA